MENVFQLGLQMTVMGMGIVFALLILLGLLISLLARWDRHRPGELSSAGTEALAGTAASRLDPALVAAILTAVLAHRAERRREAGPETRRQPPGTWPSRWVITGRTRQNVTWQPRREF